MAVLCLIRSIICGNGTRGQQSRGRVLGRCEQNLESVGTCNPLSKLGREDCLKKCPAQANSEYLARRPEKERDSSSDSHILSRHV